MLEKVKRIFVMHLQTWEFCLTPKAGETRVTASRVTVGGMLESVSEAELEVRKEVSLYLW